MTARIRLVTATERLRVSPNFVLAFTMDGRPFVEKQTEPYVQYWLTDRYRALYTLFTGPRGATVAEALERFERLAGRALDAAGRRRLLRVVDDMRGAGVLVGRGSDPSRFDARIVDAYLAHRPFPRDLVRFVADAASVGPDTRVLDLAGGPGDLALGLAERSRHVTLMELSSGFVTAARRRAASLGRPLAVLHESANRLLHDDGEYDVVTIAQAMSWLDDLAVCRGLARVLAPGGRVFVVQSAIEMADTHPLAFVLGRESILGAKSATSFPDQCRALERRLALVFDALDTPAVARVDLREMRGTAPAPRVVPAGITFFRQRRPFDAGFARAFLTPQHVAATGRTPEGFWREVERSCAQARPEALEGLHEWAVIELVRGPGLPIGTCKGPHDIAWDGAVPG